MRKYILVSLILLLLFGTTAMGAGRFRRTGSFLFHDVLDLDEKAVSIWWADDLRIPSGSQSLNSDVVAENWNANQMTILMWVKLNFTPTSGTHFLATSRPAGAGINKISLEIFGSDLYFDIRDKDSADHFVVDSIAGWSAGDWHQVVGRIDFPNNEVELYIDGVSVDAVPSNPLSGNSIDSIESVVHVGSDKGGIFQLNGAATLLVESRSWTDAEITANYAAGAGTPFVVSPDTLVMGNYSDGVTSITYHHSGKLVSATTSGGVLTTAAGADTSLAVGDDTTIQDATGFANSGRAVVEAVSDTSVTVGSQIAHAELNGSSHFFSVDDATFPATGLTGAQDLTIYAWVKITDTSGMDIVSKYNQTGDKRMFAMLQASGEIRMEISSDGTAGNTSDTRSTLMGLVAGSWHHVACVYDASAGTIDFYKDGIFIQQVGGAENTIADKDPDFIIGGPVRLGFYEGSIGPTHLFSTIRTAAQIYADAQDYDKDLSAEGNLICGYTFEDAAAATVIDNVEGTAAGDLTLVGGTTTNYGTHTRETDGAYVQGIEKVGVHASLVSGQRLHAGDNLDVGTNDFSVAIWMRDSGTGNQELIGKHDGTTGWRIYLQPGGIPALEIADADSSNAFGLTGVIRDGVWHHVALTCDRDGNYLYYVDGTQISTGDVSGEALTLSNAADFSIASVLYAGTYTGDISDVRFWDNGIWTPAEVLAMATGPHDNATGETLTSSWLLDDAANVTTLDDAQVAANNLTLVGGTTTNYGTHSRSQEAYVSRNRQLNPGAENANIGHIPDASIDSTITVTPDSTTILRDSFSEKVEFASSNDAVELDWRTYSLAASMDMAQSLEVKVESIDDSSTLFLDIDGGATPILSREIGKSLGDNGVFARSFDLGGTYYAQAANNTIHQLTTEDVGWWAWIKVNSDSTGQQSILAKESASFGHAFYLTSGGLLRVFIGEAGQAFYYTGATDLRDDQWHFVVAILDRSGNANCKVYVDAVDDTASLVGDVTNVTTITSTSILTAGAQPDFSQKFDGEITEAGIAYPADIMAANEMGAAGEIANLYNNPGDPSQWPNSEDYWLCNDNAANTTVTGANNNLTASANTDTFATYNVKRYDVTWQADQAAITAKLRVTGAGAGANAATVYLDQGNIRENLIINGSMEGTYDDESGGGGGTVNVAPGWNASAVATDGTDTLDKETTIVHSGSASQKIDVDGQNQGITLAANPGVNGKYYTISAWVYVNTGAVYIRVFGGSISPAEVVSTTTGSWEKIEMTLLSAGTFSIFIRSSGGAATFYVDDVVLTRNDTADASTADKTPGNWHRRDQVGGP